MELADQYMTIVDQLKELARELRIRNPAKIWQAARSKIPGATSRLASLALEDNTSKQILAPAYRSTGKSFATGPNEVLQSDLIDFSQNTKNTKAKYALMIADVYTREIKAKTLLNKRPETVNAAMRELVPALVQDKRDYSITTDKGKEFSKLEEGGIPAEAVHREKKATNDIAVVDRQMQSLKQDLSSIIADGDARDWVGALPQAVDAHNKRPHSAVFGAPENVEAIPEQDFRVLQTNARRGSVKKLVPFVLRYRANEALSHATEMCNCWGSHGGVIPTTWFGIGGGGHVC